MIGEDLLITGICKSILNNLTIFKLLNIDTSLILPNDKPDIKKLISTDIKIKILYKKIIETVVATSLEGQRLTGKVLLLDGYVYQTIKYETNDENLTVYSDINQIPFSTYIILDKDISKCELVVTGYIEDACIKLINERTIFSSLTILLDVKN